MEIGVKKRKEKSETPWMFTWHTFRIILLVFVSINFKNKRKKSIKSLKCCFVIIYTSLYPLITLFFGFILKEVLNYYISLMPNICLNPNPALPCFCCFVLFVAINSQICLFFLAFLASIPTSFFQNHVPDSAEGIWRFR